MDQDQRELRRAAAKAFIESLDHLAACFEPKQVCSDSDQPVADERLTADMAETTNLEAADIERLVSNE